MKLGDAIARSRRLLEESGVAEPAREAISLAAHALNLNKTFFIAHPEYELTDDESASYAAVVTRRARREPFQYIVGRQEFYGLDFSVGPGVLIPRPETELLVEHAIERLRQIERPRFCEIGVGSGCISVSILKNISSATAVAVDLSAAAIDYAITNANVHNVSERLQLLVSDLFSAVPNEQFDAVVSNPPYIAAADMATVQTEVRDFEPAAALTDGSDGLTIISQIIAASPGYMKSDAFLAIELGFGQAESVKKMMASDQWTKVRFFEDLQGIPRTMFAELK